MANLKPAALTTRFHSSKSLGIYISLPFDFPFFAPPDDSGSDRAAAQRYCLFGSRLVRFVRQNLPAGRVREEREVNMGSSSSSYAPKTIYLDVDGKVQKVGLISAER